MSGGRRKSVGGREGAQAAAVWVWVWDYEWVELGAVLDGFVLNRFLLSCECLHKWMPSTVGSD